MAAVLAFPNLTFTNPVFITHAPDGTDRLFVVEQAGRIIVFDNDPAVNLTAVFLDIAFRVTASGGELGLLGMAFDPDYTNNGYFYLNYTADGPRRSIIARYQVSADPNLADLQSEQILLTVDQPYGNHNAGMLAFGPDDMLYIPFGDGGSGGDPHGNAQNLTTLLGSMLRIDPHGGSPYGIPADNPFVGAGGGVREEAWAYGLRNPFRFSFDRDTGALWLGDVGQGMREEVNLMVAGGNYGWSVFEGNVPFDNPQNLPASSFTAPVIDYDRGLGSTVIGGYVYRGNKLPELRGAYVYADFGSGKVWALVRRNGAVVLNTQVALATSPASFGEDRDGELYICGYGGSIYTLESTGATQPSFPQRLSDTGLFTDTATLTPTASMLPFEVNSPLWSDGALKRRWLLTPPGPIDFDPTEAWSLPVGSVLVKHFELETTVGDPSTARRLETRALVHEIDGWAGYTYKWNAGQTDADLLADRVDETYTISDPAAPGGQRQQTWTYPSRTDCRQCHTAAAGHLLGLRTRQVNRLGADGVDQLDRWANLGLFSTDILASAGGPYEAYPDPSNATAPLADRARSYLAVNCAGCHLPGGPAPTTLDLRWGIAESAMNAIDVRPTAGNLGIADPWLIRPGAKESSVLWERLQRLDGFRMPALGTALVDDAAVLLIGAWIDALP